MPLGGLTKRFDTVTFAVDRMPEGHQPLRLGEQEGENPIDDGQRLREGVLETGGHARERVDKVFRRKEYAFAQ